MLEVVLIGIAAIIVGTAVHRAADDECPDNGFDLSLARSKTRLITTAIIIVFVGANPRLVHAAHLFYDGVLSYVDACRASYNSRLSGTMDITFRSIRISNDSTIDIDEGCPCRVACRRMLFFTFNTVVATAVYVTQNLATAHINGLKTCVAASLGDSLTTAKDVAFHQACIDVDHLFAPNGTHVTTTIHAVADDATIDVNPRMAFHQTCCRAKVVLLVQVNTTASAIHIAFPRVADLDSDLTSVDGHLGIDSHMAILSTSEHATFNYRCRMRLRIFLNPNLGIVDIGQILIQGTCLAMT